MASIALELHKKFRRVCLVAAGLPPLTLLTSRRPEIQSTGSSVREDSYVKTQESQYHEPCTSISRVFEISTARYLEWKRPASKFKLAPVVAVGSDVGARGLAVWDRERVYGGDGGAASVASAVEQGRGKDDCGVCAGESAVPADGTSRHSGKGSGEVRVGGGRNAGTADPVRKGHRGSEKNESQSNPNVSKKNRDGRAGQKKRLKSYLVITALPPPSLVPDVRSLRSRGMYVQARGIGGPDDPRQTF
ncbi:hypothetical protein DFH09DRAFT_1072925 [Mycena vulgaris]|nr:hypothetical protein DFH09DRAFT_1072925 [Mycena vulgaris]